MRLSKEFGLNPSLQQCPCCGKDMGIILFGDSYKDRKTKQTLEAPHRITLPGQICDECKGVIDGGGVFVIEVKDGETGDNPYRTGRLVGIKKEAAERMFGQANPISYCEHTLFEQIFGEALKEKQANA